MESRSRPPAENAAAESSGLNARALRRLRGITVGGTLFLIAHQLSFWHYTVDDAYISFRYAENLARGFGLVFNPGEYVEGYTNFLWTLLLAGAFSLGLDTELTAKAGGLVCGAGTVAIMWGLVRRVSPHRPDVPIAVATLLISTSFSFAVWSVAGLETPLFAFLTAWATLRFTDELLDRPKRPLSAVLMALATMTRPDGLLVFVVSSAFLFLAARRDPERRRWGAAWLATFVLLLGPYVFWRWWYYGYLVPNTYYVKTGRGLLQAGAGVLYTTAAITKHGGWLLWILAAVPAIAGPARQVGGYFVALVAVSLAYNVYKGHDVLPAFRFVVPVLPVLFSLAGSGIWMTWEGLLRNGLSRRAAWSLLGAFLVGALTVSLVFSFLSRRPDERLREYQVQLGIDGKRYARMGARLKEIGPPDSTIAVIDAGAIPYVTGWYTIDRYGLLDEHIAHTKGKGPLQEKYDEAYVLSKRPMFIQTKVRERFLRAGNLQAGWAGDAELLSLPEFSENYVRLKDPLLDGFYVRTDVVSRLRESPE